MNGNQKFKFLIHSMEGTGHLNACIGFAQILAQNGHEIVFAVNESITAKVEKFGFRALALKQVSDELSEKPQFKLSDNPAKDFGEQLLKMGMLSSKTPLEKAKDEVNKNHDFMESILSLNKAFNPQFVPILESEKPDCIVMDAFLFPPAFGRSKIPWIQIASAAPLMYLHAPELPPPGSGYPLNDKSDWNEFWELFEVNMHKFDRFQDDLNAEFDYVNDGDYHKAGFMFQSPYLTVQQYPEELEYNDVYTSPPNFVSLDTFCRQESEKFELPKEFADKPGDKLIYMSMGSMGSFDIDMVQRILDMFGRSPHKFIISKGPRGDELKLPDNCWGENYLPQPDIVEMVDLVITHGGNNSFTETFMAGKPMIVMPLFGDQYDNAQRVTETGYGIRLEPYTFEEATLHAAIEKLLNDSELESKLAAIRERARSSDRNQRVVSAVEQMIRNSSKSQ